MDHDSDLPMLPWHIHRSQTDMGQTHHHHGEPGPSTIKGINLLGNSVRGLDLLNWRKVYNALIIPVLTYGAQVWFTGIRQKGLIRILQVA